MFQISHICANKADNFWYISGEVTFVSQKRSIIAMIRKAYHLYFGCNIGDQDKKWAPHICYNTCATNLRQWLDRKRKCMPFAVSMTWKEPRDHSSYCYLCMMPPVGKGLSKNKKQSVRYPNIPLAIRPVPYEKDNCSWCIKIVFTWDRWESWLGWGREWGL